MTACVGCSRSSGRNRNLVDYLPTTQRQARPPRVRPHKPPALLAERISSTTAPHVTTPPLNGCVYTRVQVQCCTLEVLRRSKTIASCSPSGGDLACCCFRALGAQWNVPILYSSKVTCSFFCIAVLPALLHSLKKDHVITPD